MPRKLNTAYVRRIMQKDELRGLEAVILTGSLFGVSERNESLLGDEGWIDDDAPRRYAADEDNYRGWTKPSKLYCAKCWTIMEGIPRVILVSNECLHCQAKLWTDDNEWWLDAMGYELYRDRITQLTGLAERNFRAEIQGEGKTWPEEIVA